MDSPGRSTGISMDSGMPGSSTTMDILPIQPPVLKSTFFHAVSLSRHPAFRRLNNRIILMGERIKKDREKPGWRG